MAGWTKMPLGMKVGRDAGNFVFDGDPAPSRKKGTAHTQFFWCMSIVIRTAGWIKMPLGTEVNLGPYNVVLDGVAAPPT